LISGHFIPGAKGPIFVTVRRPREAPRGCVLVIPPFAEEMNKSRRMLTLMGQQLAQRGIATVVPDVHGTGDSGGEFEEADWLTWVQDLACVARWSTAQVRQPTGCLAIRLGAALAVSALQSGGIGPMTTSVLWQPVFDGRRAMTQFLRLRVAASLAEQDRKETAQGLLERLKAGEALEVAGYSLPGRLAIDIESQVAPGKLPAQLGSIHWLEVVREPATPVSAAAVRYAELANASSQLFVAQGFTGEPFWGSTEIVVNQPLIAATVAAFAQVS
jgi:exosortase A-associated hydrolase 2